MSHRVLFVDDDANLLEASKRVLRGSCELVTAIGGEEGLRRFEQDGPFAVVVSDLHMPVIDGVTLLQRVHARSPETIRVLLTGHADASAAIQAVNEGRIFRFLTKPCAGSVIRDALRDALEQHRLQTAERVLTEQTLRGCVRALVEMLSLVHPAIAARTSRVRRLAIELGEAVGAPDPWTLEVAALLANVGYVSLPRTTVERLMCGQTLDAGEAGRAASAPEMAAKLIANIPRLEAVQDILLLQGTNWNGSHARVMGMCQDRIPLGARVLRVAADFDTLTQRGLPVDQAIATLGVADGIYDPRVLEALRRCRGPHAPEPDTMAVRLADLQIGMIVAEDLRTADGLVVARGQEVSDPLLAHLRNHVDARIAETIVHVSFAAGGEDVAAA